MRNINNALKKNRRIFEALLSPAEGMKKVTHERLLAQGFQFKYSTHTYTNQKGDLYHFCYEYGYLVLENNWYLIVKCVEE